MPKKYKLLIDSPEYPKGTIAQQINENGIVYQLSMLGVECASELYAIHIENRPTVWQEIVDEPEKKIVERWRASLHETYYVMGHNNSSIPRTEISAIENAKNHTNGDYFYTKAAANRAITRVEIMCRLMGLAETIEEGSTECKGKHGVSYSPAECTLRVDRLTEYARWFDLATFSTKELAQLFLDSAGQDALDWYGAVK